MTTQPAYLVVHKLAFYNDEWYENLTDESEAANPAGLFSSREEAEAAVLELTSKAIRGAFSFDLLLDEQGMDSLSDLQDNPSSLGPQLAALLPEFCTGALALPADLSESQVQELQRRLNINLFHILETQAEAQEVAHAQVLLAQTPERPEVYDFGAATFEAGTPEAGIAARLSRVTQLFGRRYGTDIT